jgi:PIN domain nuclease of toxin-antitoxin system
LQKNQWNYGDSNKKNSKKRPRQGSSQNGKTEEIIQSRTMDAGTSGGDPYNNRPSSCFKIAMRYLIDTNILIFILSEPYNISRNVQPILDDYENRIYVSSESIKEVVCLFHEGRVKPKTWKYADDIFDTVEKELGFTISYIKKEHLKTLAALTPVKGHNDHCDHLIISHAMTEKMPVISSDGMFKYYKKQGLDLIDNEK